ncbi:MAG: hypothetical protein OEX97_10620, partial [Acidimicrobiia bacterium]|nr:hypothetical protein [Acidimicrobiia bacterium]
EPGAFTPEGYEVAESSIWGQGAFRAMFGQALDDATATAAAVGWGGDVYRLLWDGADEIVFDLSYVADSPVDAAEMFDTLSEFALLQIRGEVTESEDGYLEMSGDDFALVYSGEQIIRFVVATDSDIGRLFIEELNS